MNGQAELAHLQELLVQIREEKDSVEQELSVVRFGKGHAEQLLSEEKEAHQKIIAETESLKMELTCLRQSKKSFDEKLIEETETHRKSLADQEAETIRRIEQKESELQTGRTALRTAEKDLTTIKAQCDAFSKEITDLKTELANKSQALTESCEQKAILQAELSQEVEKYGQISLALQENKRKENTAIRKLSEALRKECAQSSELEERLKVAQTDKDKAVAETHKLGERNGAQNKRLAKVEERNKKLESLLLVLQAGAPKLARLLRSDINHIRLIDTLLKDRTNLLSRLGQLNTDGNGPNNTANDSATIKEFPDLSNDEIQEVIDWYRQDRVNASIEFAQAALSLNELSQFIDLDTGMFSDDTTSVPKYMKHNERSEKREVVDKISNECREKSKIDKTRNERGKKRKVEDSTSNEPISKPSASKRYKRNKNGDKNSTAESPANQNQKDAVYGQEKTAVPPTVRGRGATKY